MFQVVLKFSSHMHEYYFQECSNWLQLTSLNEVFKYAHLFPSTATNLINAKEYNHHPTMNLFDTYPCESKCLLFVCWGKLV